ncbi:MAG: hypothetical protein WBL80_02880 [Erysipelotrichaceae bacterium]
MEQTTAGSGRCPDPESKSISNKHMIEVEVECWSVEDAKKVIEQFSNMENVQLKIQVLQKFQ